MKNGLFGKGVVCGIIVLFVGISSIPMASSLVMERHACATLQIGKNGSRDDTTPPVTTASLAPPEPNANGWYNTLVWVTLNATDDESGVNVTYYRINGGEWVIYTSSFIVPYYGVVVVEFYSIDNAGNVETPKQVEFKVDITPPTTTCTVDPPAPNGENGWYVGNLTITLYATDDLSGVNATYYKANGEPWKIYTDPFVIYKGWSFGSYSVDNAGNQEPPHFITLTGDREPPVIFLNKEIKLNKIIYTATTTDSMSGIASIEFYLSDVLKCTENGSGPIFEWTLTPIPHTNEIVKVIVYDRAGNNASVMANTSKSVDHDRQSIYQNHPSSSPPHNQPGNPLLQNLITYHSMAARQGMNRITGRY
jgi:hypothetical protein